MHGSKCQCPSTWHGFNGIHCHGQESLLKLIGVAVDQRQLWAELSLQCDPMDRKMVIDETDALVKDCIEVLGLEASRLGLREEKEDLDHVPTPNGLVGNEGKLADHLL